MIDSKQALIRYCLHKLGEPVIQVNIAPEQIEYCIDEALEKYYEFHGDGSQRLYLKHVVTQDDITKGFVPMPVETVSVVRVLNSGPASSLNMNNLSHVAYITDIVHGLGRNGLGSYAITMSYLGTIEHTLVPDHSIRFVRHGHLLRFDAGQIHAGDLIVIETYHANTVDNFPETWGDQWLKRYATARLKKQWADNLIKYQNFQLPSGITIDGQSILAEAKEELEALEQELRNTWADPVMPMIG